MRRFSPHLTGRQWKPICGTLYPSVVGLYDLANNKGRTLLWRERRRLWFISRETAAIERCTVWTVTFSWQKKTHSFSAHYTLKFVLYIPDGEELFLRWSSVCSLGPLKKCQTCWNSIFIAHSLIVQHVYSPLDKLHGLMVLHDAQVDHEN